MFYGIDPKVPNEINYIIEDGVTVFTSGKDQIFKQGTPVGVTDEKGSVILFSEPNQLSIIKIDLNITTKENF